MFHKSIAPPDFSGNQGNHQNFEKFLVPYKLWLIWVRVKQKKIFFEKRKTIAYPLFSYNWKQVFYHIKIFKLNGSCKTKNFRYENRTKMYIELKRIKTKLDKMTISMRSKIKQTYKIRN